MKTLIYLDDALKLISDTYWMTETEKATLSEKLKTLPPVDAVPVQRGTWIHHIDEFDGETEECKREERAGNDE